MWSAPGYTPSERAVIPRLHEIFSQTKKKLFFSCFSSSIYRIRIALELARKHGRKAVVLGRSMMESTEIAQDLGYIEVPPGLVINPGQMRDYPPDELMILISGTQGEPMSALSRAAVDNHKHAHIDAGDTVVLSSRIIPATRRVSSASSTTSVAAKPTSSSTTAPTASSTSADTAARKNCACSSISSAPSSSFPIHGDYRNLRRHAQLAMETGAVEHALVIEDGDVLELDQADARKKDKVTAGRILIDSGSTIDVVEDLVVRDRRILSEDGIVLAILAINKRMGKVEREPEIVMRGFGGADITEEARQVVLKTIDALSSEQKTDYGMVKEKVRVELKRLIQKTTGRRPMIMPVILEI